MTALHQYSRLEAAGLWRSAPDAQAREVIVGLRKATLVLLDPKTDMPLAQWSLPAVIRQSETAGFVVFASHDDGDETLEIDDPDMIAALDKVRAAIETRRRRPGRLRRVLVSASLIAISAAALIWVPLRLIDFTAKRLPDAVRRDISAMTMRDVATISGSACSNRLGAVAATSLARRIALGFDGAAQPSKDPDIIVLREGITAAATLPDGTILLPYATVQNADSPDTLAGIVMAQMLRSTAEDPLLPALRHAGIFATFQVLAQGALPADALQGFGLDLASAPPAPVDPAALHSAMARAQITSLPYAAIAGDPALSALPDAAAQGSQPAVLDDAEFLALQYICDG